MTLQNLLAIKQLLAGSVEGQVLVRQAKLGRVGWSLRKSGLKLRKELSG